jgi:hypothetical protein
MPHFASVSQGSASSLTRWMTSRTAQENLVGALLAVFCAGAQFRLIAMMFQIWYGRAAEAAYGVTIGMPHWRSYQSRVLGPYLIDGLAWVFPNYLSAHVFLSIVTLAVAGFLAWRLGLLLANTVMGAGLALFTFQILFVFCLTLPWIYIWDYLSVAIFFAFVVLVVQQKSWAWFCGLFAIAVLNRENAFFIALWMIIDPLIRFGLVRRKVVTGEPVNRSMIAAGTACLVVGAGVTEFLRRTLLVKEVGYELFRDSPQAHFESVQNQLGNNFASLVHALTTFDYNMQFVVIVLIAAMIAAAVYLARVDPIRWAGLALIHIASVVAIFLVGVLMETRLLVELIPLSTAAVVVAATRSKRGDGRFARTSADASPAQ